MMSLHPSQVSSKKACDTDYEFYQQIMKCEDPELQSLIADSLEVLGDALRLYGTEHCMVSYNGGKDADVVLHLTRAAVGKHNHDAASSERPKLAYFEDPRDFEEVAQHVKETVSAFQLDMRVCGADVREELATIVSERPQQISFVLGTRKGDPNCGTQGAFAPSSAYMPKFMRVNPILNWSFGSVWTFLSMFSIPYCKLYDEGYTSLGRKDNTAKNPALRKEDGSYAPAQALRDFSMERAGRESKPSKDMTMTPEETSRMLSEAREVSLLIVGDEVLEGKVEETNSVHALAALRKHGLKPRQVAIVRDEIDEIAAELQRLSANSDLVFTSGGVGPTHDDVTLKAVAQVCGTSLETNRQMLELLHHLKAVPEGDSLSAADARLAVLPVGAQLLPPSKDGPPDQKQWPLLLCKNIFVLPGVPKFFQAKFDTILREYLPPRHLVTRRLILAAPEPELVGGLDMVVAEHPGVKIGSYPVETEGKEGTVVMVEGRDGDTVSLLAAVEALQGVFKDKVVSVDEIDAVGE